MSNREQFEALGMSDTDLRITLECETYAGIAWLAWQAATNEAEAKLTGLTSQLESVVAENAVSNDRLQKLIQIINNADNSYCMCGDAMRNHAHGGCGYPTGMFDYHYSQWLESAKETPATAAFLAEVRAQESKRVYESILDNPSVTDMTSLVDWLEQYASDSLAFAAQLRQGGAV